MITSRGAHKNVEKPASVPSRPILYLTWRWRGLNLTLGGENPMSNPLFMYFSYVCSTSSLYFISFFPFCLCFLYTPRPFSCFFSSNSYYFPFECPQLCYKSCVKADCVRVPAFSSEIENRICKPQRWAVRWLRRVVASEAWVRFRVSPCEICGGQSGTGTGFIPEYFGFPLSISFHRCSITRKNEKKKLIIFITELHNKSEGCGAPEASAAGPFTTKIRSVLCSCLYETYLDRAPRFMFRQLSWLYVYESLQFLCEFLNGYLYCNCNKLPTFATVVCRRPRKEN
jgi:hypothetical protein